MYLEDNERETIKELIALELKRLDYIIKTLEKELDYVDTICGKDSISAKSYLEKRRILNERHNYLSRLAYKI
jgi:hypothetical protein